MKPNCSNHTRRCLIIQPGAVGDCILTLPLAEAFKHQLGVDFIEFAGREDYINYFPYRTSVDKVSSIETFYLHRLFVEPSEFDPDEKDPVIKQLAGYDWIITFLSDSEGSFEQNLLFAANCSNQADVITIALKPPADFSGHISDFYIEQFNRQSQMRPLRKILPEQKLITPISADFDIGRELLGKLAMEADRDTVIIHPGSGSGDKCWALDNFCEIACELQKQDINVIFLIGPAEKENFGDEKLNKIKTSFNMLCNLKLEQAVGLISCCSLYVGNDSGLTHLSGCIGTKTIAIFTATNPLVYSPAGSCVETISIDSEDFVNDADIAKQAVIRKISALLSIDC